MAKDSSFDITSEVDLQEVDNALNQTMREIANRFDFRGSISKIEREELVLKIVADSQIHLTNLVRILEEKFVKRGVSLMFLDPQKVDSALGGTLKQEIKLKQGLTQEKSKEICLAIREGKFKVKTTIEGDKVRVSGAKKDDLQAVMAMIKEKEFGIAVQFGNYR